MSAYQQRVEGWEGTLEERFGRLDELLDEYDRVRSPLLSYLQQYDTAAQLMRDACKAMADCAVPMKK